jgi:phage terminase large subunit-like protein
MATKTRTRTKTRRRNTSREEPDDPVLAYAEAVLSGAIVAGPHVRNACRRHLDDLKRGPARGLVWDLTAAKRAMSFFPDALRLNGGQFEGKPFDLDLSQAFRIGSLFGWKRADGMRRFRRFYDEEGKGNGKSPFSAGIGLYGLVADGEDRAEIYAAGKDKDQAMVLFRDAVAMVDQSPALTSRIKQSGQQPSVWNLALLERSSFFRPISKEGGKSGPRPHFALCDEVHEHPDGAVIDMLERGFKFRRQPLLIMTTNSGSDRQTVCWQEHVHAIRAAAGNPLLEGREGEDLSYLGDADSLSIYDDTFAFVCSLDEGDDPLEDPSCWPKVNPLLGRILTEDYLAGAVRQAKAIPGRANSILRLHFCVWTDAEKAWMARGTLEQCLEEFDPGQFVGERVCAGADLSGSQDLTAVAYICQTGEVDLPRERTLDDGSIVVETVRLPTFHAWCDTWTPGDTLAERALRDQAPYEIWRDQGWLRAPPGRQIRLDFVAARIVEVETEFRLDWLAYDRYAYRKLEEYLDEMGSVSRKIEHPQGGKRRAAAPDDVIEAARENSDDPQGLWMPGSLAMLETLILEKRITIQKNPVLISAFASATTEEDPFGNRWFSKRKAVKRIDPLVSLAMAVGAATANFQQARQIDIAAMIA